MEEEKLNAKIKDIDFVGDARAEMIKCSMGCSNWCCYHYFWCSSDGVRSVNGY